MSSSFEKSVKGATKIKNAPPKTKYIEHILVATHSGEAGIAEVIRALQYRLRDSTWTVVFKSLITVHLMIREGSPDVTLAYLSKNRQSLAISNFADAQTQGRNIRHYANYLSERSRAFRDTHTDWVRAPESRLEKLSIDKGLLRETEFVQRQISALVRCDVLDAEPENEITITVFRLLVLDLLSLFQVLNQGLINILGHFFEMSKPDAERAMDIYRTFTKQTDYVVQYLSVARQHEHHTRVQVPKIKHAPVHLGKQLEDYLKDPDFEINRRQFIAEQDAKKGRTTIGVTSKPAAKDGIDFPKPADNNPFPASSSSQPAVSSSTAAPKANKGPELDLIDFFESIEDKQTTMQVNPPAAMQQPDQTQAFQPQPMAAPQFASNGFAPQQTGFQSNDPYAQQQQTSGFVQQQPPQLQPISTGAAFGGFSPQQQAFSPQQQQGGFSSPLGSIPQSQPMDFQNTGFQMQQQQQSAPQQTGFQAGGLQPMATGQQMTNPFRQSMLMTQQTGAGPGLTRQSTNPFARSTPQQGAFGSGNSTPIHSQVASPLQATPTGTNPFARNVSPQTPVDAQQTPGGSLVPQPTGQTNPFRQGAFVNHSTGMGWQHNQQPIGGGIDQVQTQPVFPRPAQQTPWQQ